MIKKITVLFFMLCIVLNGYSQSRKKDTKQKKDELVTIQISADELRKILNDRDNVPESNIDDVSESNIDDVSEDDSGNSDDFSLKFDSNDRFSRRKKRDMSTRRTEQIEYLVPQETETREDYVNILLFKHKKNKGYRKQPFEDKKKYALLEKGVSFVSFKLGFMSSDIDDYLLEPVAIVDELYNRNFSGSFSAGHFITNNTAIGAKVNYRFGDTRFKVTADILDIVIGAKTYETNNVSNRYTGGVYVKNFIPLDAAQRFFIVSETNLGYSYTNSLSKNTYDNGTKVTKVKTQKDAVSIGLSPGFMYFMSSGFGFEFNMSPVVAYWSRTRTINNEVDHGGAQNYGLMFKFMPFNINFGFAYYFGLDYNKHRSYIKKMNL